MRKKSVENFILFVGTPYHSELLTKQFNQEWPDIANNLNSFHNIKFINDSNTIYGICFKPKTIFYLLIGKLFGKRTILHWIGTDVYLLNKIKILKWLAKKLCTFFDKNYSSSKFLKKELLELGIKSKVNIILPLLKKTNNNMPKKVTVLWYTNPYRYRFFGYEKFIKLVKEFTNVRFLVVNSKHKPHPIIRENKEKRDLNFKNVEYLGHVADMNKVYDRTTVLLRIPKHDGLSLMVLEALLKEKQVIYSYPLNHCFYVKDYDDIRKALKKIIKMKNRRNKKGRKYVKKNLINKSYLKMRRILSKNETQIKR